MYNIRKLTDDLSWIGGSDRKIQKFENVYKLNSGMNYNSYFLDSGACILIDTVDKALEDVFLENLAYCLNGRTLDYIIVQHMEPDHSATLANVLDANDQAKMTNLIRNERRIELCFENKRFWDLRRWLLPLDEPVRGVQIDRNDDTGELTYRIFEVEKREYNNSYQCYGPIPKSEILKWSNLKQNKGWQ